LRRLYRFDSSDVDFIKFESTDNKGFQVSFKSSMHIELLS
jgi:hypothetical protein